MDSTIQLLLIILSSLCTFFLFICCYYQFSKPSYGKTTKNRVPRAGGALPIIGHLHLFGKNQLLHKTLAAMAEKYGPAFIVRLGSQETLVVSTSEMAKECFTTHDRAFSDRPKITSTRLLSYDFAMFGFAPYGPYWREMRKIVTLELLSHRRIDMLSHIRALEVKTSLRELYDLWVAKQGLKKTGVLVDMKQWFGDLTLNAAVQMVGGKRFVGEKMKDFFYFFGVFVVSDAIPFLRWLDLQGYEKAMKRVAKELDGLIGEWLVEHKERREMKISSGEEKVDEDFMDVMLSILEDADIPDFDADTINKATCLNLILAGSDSMMVALTWALSLLLNNPLVLKKAQDEVDTHVPKNRHVQESDIKNLVYLQAVVKETLRLYPPAPVIGLHSAMEDCTISPGYHVPSGTRLMVNAWKIHRDESIWPEPHEFRPERFLTSHKDIDVRGQNFELIPFGSGRRSCPGTSLSLQMVHLTLASLLHCFDFAKPGDAEIDMTESQGLTNLKATPLEVYLTPRLHPETFVNRGKRKAENRQVNPHTIQISDDIYPTKKSHKAKIEESTSEENIDDTGSWCSDKAVTQKATSIAYQKALDFVSSHHNTPKNPFFISLLQQSYVSGGFILNVPVSFARRNIPCVGSISIIMVMHGKKWCIRCLVGKNHTKLSVGWKDFVKDNGLKVGDACVFEVTNKSSKLVWNVVIFRS
ncbi:cytochrome p450 82c4 [Phtheirospermum japonicum]|uniref:Flavonoid-6-hydroxylase n=1 Tax=Phtheirospermum japonicum TaxID=374723 RepID=A0A830B0I4_9LAMI|nr:cytochrome p450 82c4 [Phtheirospermum japonicum]